MAAIREENIGRQPSAEPARGSEDNTDALIRDAVNRKWKAGYFKYFPEYGIEDIVQECAIAVFTSRADFDPTLSAWSTWVNRVSSCQMSDMHRKKSRHSGYEAAAATGRDYAQATAGGGRDDRRVPIYYPTEVIDPPARLDGEDDIFEGEIVGGNGHPSLVEWLYEVYGKACRFFNLPRHRRGRRNFTAAQQAAVAMLMKYKNYTTRGARGVFEDREDLRKVIGFDKDNLPSHMWFWRAADVVTPN